MSARLRPLALVAVFAAMTLFATGCTTGTGVAQSLSSTVADGRPLAQLDLLADPREYYGASTAALASGVIEPVAADPIQELPVTVDSHDPSGVQRVVVQDASRVIALDIAGSIASTVWGLGLGDLLVGRDVSTTFAGVNGLPVVTSMGHTIDAEAVLALRPTLVITDGSVGPRDVLEQLREVGVTVVFVDRSPSFDSAVDLARQVAAALGASDTGELLAVRIRSEIDAKIAEIQAILPTDRVRMMFLYLRGGSGIYYMFGSESGADRLISALGGVDVAAEIGWVGMRPITDEAIVAANPDLILVMSGGIQSAGGVEGLLAEKPALGLTKAGQNHRFVDMADGDILSFGPRSAAVLDALARAIYAPTESGS
jgi:iron complex transport system substrate-binding protein